MALIAKQPEGGSDFEPIPEGQYVARCYRVIDLGTQENEYMGEIKYLPKVMVTWEILDDPKMGDGRPFSISKTYTLSLHEKSNMFKDLTSWRGKTFTKDELLGFDITSLVGAYCQIQVVHNTSKDGSRTFANINAIMGTKERPKGVNPDAVFDVNNPDMDLFESFSDYLKDRIRNSEEWKAKDIEARGRGEDKSIDAKDIDIDKDITIDDIKDPEEEKTDLKDIPF
jgi:hypothetical protein